MTAAADRGAVTVEAALALGTLALVTALAVGAVAAVGASVRCTDAARELARLAARGEPDRGRAVAAALAPSGARIVLTIRGDEATAEVTAPPVAALPVHVVGRAVAVLEPGSPPAAQPAGSGRPRPLRRGGSDVVIAADSTGRPTGPRRSAEEVAVTPTRSGAAADRGIATIWAATAVAVLIGVLLAMLDLAAAVAARHRAEGAADLAALAAAGQAARGADAACRRAEDVAAGNGGRVVLCRLDGWEATVEVDVNVRLSMLGTATVPGRARAGPTTDTPPALPDRPPEDRSTPQAPSRQR